MEKSNLDTASFDILYPKRRFYPSFKHNPKHILAAQKLADWLEKKAHESIVGKPTKKTNVTSGRYGGKDGILFIKNGWGDSVHIDVWDGKKMKSKSGDPACFSLGKQVWFWELT